MTRFRSMQRSQPLPCSLYPKSPRHTVSCNECGCEFSTNRADASRITCPHCGGNTSLSIRSV